MDRYDKDWDRNRRSSTQYRNDDYNRSNESRSFDNDRSDFDDDRRRPESYSNRGNYGNQYDQDRSDYQSGRSNYGNSYSSDRDRNDYGNFNQSRTGNSGYMSRGTSDYSRGDRDYDWNDRRRNYSRSQPDNRSNDERNWWDKTRDEISSWFGDDDAERRRRRDEKRENYRGRGPKGYVRSDERIREDINDRLTDDPNVDASGIEVTVNNCEVTLSGYVNSRWAKRHAEDITESVSGVKNVENRLKAGSGTSDTDYNTNTGTSTGSSTGTPKNASVPPVGAYEQSKS